MADNSNNNNTGSTTSVQPAADPQPVSSSIWNTVDTSTSINVERLEIRKSEDYDRIVKKP